MCCKSRSTHHVESTPSASGVTDSYTIASLRGTAKSHPPILIDVVINGIECTMEVDTGAEVTVISVSLDYGYRKASVILLGPR